MNTTTNSTMATTQSEPGNLTSTELDRIVGGVGLGLRKSSGGNATGVMFLAFEFKLVA